MSYLLLSFKKGAAALFIETIYWRDCQARLDQPKSGTVAGVF